MYFWRSCSTELLSMLCGAFHDTAKNPARAPSEPSTFGRGKYRVTTALQTHTLVIVPRLLPLNLPGIPILFSTIYAGLPLERHLPRSVISNVAAFRHHFLQTRKPRRGTSRISAAVHLPNPTLRVSFHLTKWLLYLPTRNHLSQVALSGDLLAVISGWMQAKKLVRRRRGTLARTAT